MVKLLTYDEQVVIDRLADAWNKFLTLPEVHSADKTEFMAHIHAAQNIIMSRPVIREQTKIDPILFQRNAMFRHSHVNICKHCGQSPLVYRNELKSNPNNFNEWSYQVQCVHCGIATYPHMSLPGAIEAWNSEDYNSENAKAS